MTAKRLKEWAKHLFDMASKCDDPVIKAFILGKADTVGLEYLNRKDSDEDFRNLLLSTVNDYYTKLYEFIGKTL